MKNTNKNILNRQKNILKKQKQKKCFFSSLRQSVNYFKRACSISQVVNCWNFGICCLRNFCLSLSFFFCVVYSLTSLLSHEWERLHLFRHLLFAQFLLVFIVFLLRCLLFNVTAKPRVGAFTFVSP